MQYYYIDESGSINNHDKRHCPYFVIAIIRVYDKEKLKRAYKRFVASNINRLRELDEHRINKSGEIVRKGGKMFVNGKFVELKGTQFDADMKRKFISFFSEKPYCDIFFIKVNNSKLTDDHCKNTARVFNYQLKLAFNYFIKKRYIPDEDCLLQLDERNERTETKYFLEEYLNTELKLSGACSCSFRVNYFDSANNQFVQIADVFANWFYSHLLTGAYETELEDLKNRNIIKYVFEFPK